MRSFWISVPVFLCSIALSREIADNHGDPFQKQWRRQKTKTVSLIRKMDSSRLLPNASAKVRKWLSEISPNGETKFELIATELENSPLIFSKVTPENPEGHNPDRTCAQTGKTPYSPIQISKVDCGNIESEEMLEVLIGEAIHHFGEGDDFSDEVSASIFDGYQYYTNNDPMFIIEKRYAGRFMGKDTTLTIDIKKGTLKQIRGGLNLNLTNLPPLQGTDLMFRTTGECGSYIYYTYDEHLLSGKEVPGTRRYHRVGLNCTITIEVNKDTDSISLRGTFERRHPDKLGKKVEENFNFSMLYSPPTPQELEEERLLKNTSALYKILSKKPLEILPTDEDTTLALVKSGVKKDFQYLVTGALNQRFWKLLDLLVPQIPENVTIKDILFSAIDSNDENHFQKILSYEPLKRHIQLEAERNAFTPLGTILNSVTGKTLAAVSAQDKKAAIMAQAILEAGVKTTAPITRSVSVPRLPLNYLTANFVIPVELMKALTQKMSPQEINAYDERKRTSYDYLAMHWSYLAIHCKAPSEKAKATLELLLENHRAAYRLLVAAGHDGKRRGCLYYDLPQGVERACEWNESSGRFSVHYKTNFSTEPQNWVGERPMGYDICG